MSGVRDGVTIAVALADRINAAVLNAAVRHPRATSELTRRASPTMSAMSSPCILVFPIFMTRNDDCCYLLTIIHIAANLRGIQYVIVVAAHAARQRTDCDGVRRRG
jgi:hypothetical protein